MDDMEALWIEYSKTKDKKLKNDLILHYIHIVKYVAGRLSIHMGQYIEYDDLVSYGVFGLIDAIDKFDIKSGNKFTTYAQLRVRGEIIDQIRKMDWIPRSTRQKNKLIETTFKNLKDELEREPSNNEMAEALGLTLDEYIDMRKRNTVSSLLSIDEPLGNEEGTIGDTLVGNKSDTPETSLSKAELKRMLVDALDGLTEKEKIVISLYYFDELTLKEISAVLEVTESRISQIHSKALIKLQNKLGKHREILFAT